MISPPVWFNDREAAPIRELMVWFVRQLDQIPYEQRVRGLRRKLSTSTMPALFDYSAADSVEFLWEALAELSETPYCLWTDQKGKRLEQTRSGELVTLMLSSGAEPLLRDWLNMPLIEPVARAWMQAVDSWADKLDKEKLLQVGYLGVYRPEKILSALYRLHTDRPKGPLTWRQLSARYFEGDSKFLDSTLRRGQLIQLFPELETTVSQRPLLLNAHLVSSARGVLIVENQDSFCWLRRYAASIPDATQLQLVYGHGFTGSAGRARNHGATTFFYSGCESEILTFEDTWFGSTESIPVYFWGDLDFSAIGIIKALRLAFPALEAWQTGYAPMVEELQRGGGHEPSLAGKANQLNPGLTGCAYTDTVLLPLLMDRNRCLDQEWITPADIQ